MNDLPRENKKLQYLIDTYAKGSQNAFAELIGVSQANINRLFRKDERNKEYPNVIKSKSTLIAINNKYDFATIEWFKKEDDLHIWSSSETKSNLKSNYTSGVPYYDVDFTASFLEVDNNSQTIPTSYINHPFFAGCDYVVRASGQSMAKVIAHGDAIGLIKVDNWQEFFPFGEIYAIVTKRNMRMIKVITKGETEDTYT